MSPSLKPCPSCLCHVELDTSRCPFCSAPIGETTIHHVACAFGLVATLAGCGPQVDDSAATGDGSSTGVSAGSSGGMTSASTSSSTTSGDTTTVPTTADTSSSSTAVTGTESGTFIDSPDGGSLYGGGCDIWNNDCPEGDKCMPWANDGLGSWNAVRCSPVPRDAAAVGASCTVEGSPTSGIDDCELGSMCFHVDPITNEGVCVAFCTGTRAAPSCADPEQVCSITHEGTLILCLTPCDPLAPECPDGHSCQAGTDAFVCVRAGEGAIGDPCRQFVDCELGASCIPGATPECEESCCTEACDPAEPVCGLPEQSCTAVGDAGVCTAA
ncbi:MAG: hypothetical protein IAG13_14870 [Deltaproteobacteria bacterium]|nr:hypothetical protein [Nannocystaceae bacterium]